MSNHLEQILASLVHHQQQEIARVAFKDALDDIGTFDGNPSMVHEFVTTITTFHDELITQNQQAFVPKFISALKNSKILGKASLRIKQSNCQTFAEIKATLLETYTDNRPIESYILNLADAKPLGKTPFEFLEYLDKIKIQATNQVRIVDPDHPETLSKVIEGVAVKSFQRSIPDPLKTHVYAGKPKKLSEIKALLRDHFFYEASQTIGKYEAKTSSKTPFKPFLRQEETPHQIKNNPSTSFHQKSPHFKANSNAMSTRTTNTVRTLHNTEEDNNFTDNSTLNSEDLVDPNPTDFLDIASDPETGPPQIFPH